MNEEFVMSPRDEIWNVVWSICLSKAPYTRDGHGPSGAIGKTHNEITLATWPLSLGVFEQSKNESDSIKNGRLQLVVTCHAEYCSRRRTQTKDSWITFHQRWCIRYTRHPENRMILLWDDYRWYNLNCTRRSLPEVIIRVLCAVLLIVSLLAMPVMMNAYTDAVESDMKHHIKNSPMARIMFDRYHERRTNLMSILMSERLLSSVIATGIIHCQSKLRCDLNRHTETDFRLSHFIQILTM